MAEQDRPLTGRDVRAAEELARRMLASLPERVRHSAAVAARAVSLAGAVADDEVNLLVASAWLHDIGYAAALQDTGFHPVDGARFLRSLGWDRRLCGLVAHHSGSRFVAPHRDLDAAMGEFPHVQDAVSDALTVADQAVGPHGKRLALEERMADMLRRHGPESPQAKAHPERSAYIRAAARRVDARLAAPAVHGAYEPVWGPISVSGGAPPVRLLLPLPRRG
jgi:putative nucleotidyltransferase with HDIG domain